jgi:predicted deacylase
MEKTKEQRVREAVELMKKIKNLPTEFLLYAPDKGFLQIQAAVSDWVKTGVATSLQIPLYRQGRVAELNLPTDSSVASLNLKVARDGSGNTT